MPYFRVKVKKNTKKKLAESNKKPLAYKKVIFFILSLLLAALIAFSFYLLYFKSAYFKVENIILSGHKSHSSVNYSDLERMIIGENIFSLRLREIRSYMLDNYRELRDLRLSRAFPDSVFAAATMRKPVAQLYQRQYYPVDVEGVVLSGVRDEPDDKLPIISGIRADLSSEIGKESDSERIKQALAFLKELEASTILDKHKLIEIDISNLRNLIFFLEDGVEVKVGYKDFAARLVSLKRVLDDPKLNTADIRYIDLRFKEPVIGTKWKR